MSEKQSRWAFRALAAAIAFGIWLAASFFPRLQERTVRPIEENVQVAGVSFEDHDVMVVVGSPILGSPDDPREALLVRIRGNEDAFESLNRERIRVQVPLGENLFDGPTYGGPREVEVILTTENVVLPNDAAGIQVVSITPERLTLTLDEEVTDQVPVQVEEWRGEPIGGFIVDHANVTIVPEYATVSGPRSEINRLGYALAGPIDIDGRGVRFDKEEVPLRFEGDNVVVLFPPSVRVEVPMIQGPEPRSVPLAGLTNGEEVDVPAIEGRELRRNPPAELPDGEEVDVPAIEGRELRRNPPEDLPSGEEVDAALIEGREARGDAAP